MVQGMKKISLPSVNKFEWVRALSVQPRDQITRTEHHIALALAGYLTAAGTGFTTQATLANDCRVSERTVCTALTSLVNKGWLLRRSGRQGLATTYWTRIPADAVSTSSRPTHARTAVDVSDYLKMVANACGLAEIQIVDGSDAITNLTGSLAHILAVIEDRPDDSRRLFESLTEAPLITARDPAAVLLYRLGQLVRANPHLLVPTPEIGASAADVEAAVQRAMQHLTGLDPENTDRDTN
jgi:hypothetical protein